MSQSSNASSGIGFCGLLTIAFIVLKLTGVIDWSWWLVLLPVLIPCGFIVLMLILAVTLFGIALAKVR